MYNTTPVTLDVALETAHLYLESDIVPVLISAPGIGKTSLARQLADRLGAKLVPIRLNNMPPEEAIGLQFIDREAGCSVHLPPYWLPKEDGSDGPTLLFFDEITQAPDDFRKGVMSILNERYLGSRKLPDNCYVMAAGNSAEDGSNVYEFDRATADRFGVILVRTDVDSWCNNYAAKHALHLSVVAFLRNRPDAFEMSEEAMKGDNVIAPSPRTWEKLSNAICRYEARLAKLDKNDTDQREILDKAFATAVLGKLGEGIGSAFLSVFKEITALATIQDLLDMSKEKRRQNSPKTMDALWMYGQGLIWYASDIQRLRSAFDLLDSFEEIKDVPFFETRFTVAETMLERARSVHAIKGYITDPALQEHMRRWREAVKNIDVAGHDGTDKVVKLQQVA